MQSFRVDLTFISGIDLDKPDNGHTILGKWYEFGWEVVKCNTISVLAQISLDELSSKIKVHASYSSVHKPNALSNSLETSKE